MFSFYYFSKKLLFSWRIKSPGWQIEGCCTLLLVEEIFEEEIGKYKESTEKITRGCLEKKIGCKYKLKLSRLYRML